MSDKEKIETREQRLAEYWRARAGLDRSDFDDITSRVLPDRFRAKNNTPIGEYVADIARNILGGFPLTFSEYHLAIASGMLLTELTYEEFYKTRWHETKEKRGYIPFPEETDDT